MNWYDIIETNRDPVNIRCGINRELLWDFTHHDDITVRGTRTQWILAEGDYEIILRKQRNKRYRTNTKRWKKQTSEQKAQFDKQERRRIKRIHLEKINHPEEIQYRYLQQKRQQEQLQKEIELNRAGWKPYLKRPNYWIDPLTQITYHVDVASNMQAAYHTLKEQSLSPEDFLKKTEWFTPCDDGVQWREVDSGWLYDLGTACMICME